MIRGMMSRPLASGLLATALTAGLVALAPSASAAYEVVGGYHGSDLQACRTTTDGGEPAVRFRLDSRDAGHVHSGGLFRTRENGATARFTVKPAVGRVSAPRTVVVRSTDEIGWFVSDPNSGTGGDLRRGSLPRC
ncbi:hypothetical protein GCM10009737_05880 [Nocardioides lentus]|uniref:PLAT domain-containing protein n=2 Tax=Nocardioides lentus TaxID=338077 RepID=A0ABP5AAI7_9ACTN